MMTSDTPRRRITGVVFAPHVYRSGVTGDNFCQTWAADDLIYTSLDDGYGWDAHGPHWNNRVFGIRGAPDAIEPVFLDNYPNYLVRNEWYGFGIISVRGTLYHFVTCASNGEFAEPFQGAKLLYSPDFGKTWLRHDGVDAHHDPMSKSHETMFFWHEDRGYPFSWVEILQAGRDYADAQDDYVYLYSNAGRHYEHNLMLARVPTDRILDRAAYTFFVARRPGGEAVWSPKYRDAAPIHLFPDNFCWCCWLPSVVYNKPLGLYIMANYGTGRNGTQSHDLQPTLGLYWADRPWGPWHEFHYEEAWFGDDPGNRLYQPKLSPKWISDDGRQMVLIYSDARDNWTTNYKWNHQKITLLVD